MDRKDAAAPVLDLAMRIYIELVGRHTEIAGGAVKMSASAADLATLSMKLAEAFVKANEDAAAAKAPVKNYSLQATDISEWLK